MQAAQDETEAHVIAIFIWARTTRGRWWCPQMPSSCCLLLAKDISCWLEACGMICMFCFPSRSFLTPILPAFPPISSFICLQQIFKSINPLLLRAGSSCRPPRWQMRPVLDSNNRTYWEGGGGFAVMWKWFGLRVKFIIITLISQASALATAKGNMKAYLSQFGESTEERDGGWEI